MTGVIVGVYPVGPQLRAASITRPRAIAEIDRRASCQAAVFGSHPPTGDIVNPLACLAVLEPAFNDLNLGEWCMVRVLGGPDKQARCDRCICKCTAHRHTVFVSLGQIARLSQVARQCAAGEKPKCYPGATCGIDLAPTHGVKECFACVFRCPHGGKPARISHCRVAKPIV